MKIYLAGQNGKRNILNLYENIYGWRDNGEPQSIIQGLFDASESRAEQSRAEQSRAEQSRAERRFI